MRVPTLARQMQLAGLRAVKVCAQLHQLEHRLRALTAHHLDHLHVAKEIAGHHGIGRVALDGVERVKYGTDATLPRITQAKIASSKVRLFTETCHSHHVIRCVLHRCEMQDNRC